MNENNKNRFNVQDEQLVEVTGGNHRLGYDCEVVTSNSSIYKSGDTPKYFVGQQLEIICSDYRRSINYYVPCEVLAVSTIKDCGTWCKEFGYKIKILYNEHFPRYTNTILENVYESCLYEK